VATGLSVAAVTIPVAIAYAQLAGFPPVVVAMVRRKRGTVMRIRALVIAVMALSSFAAASMVAQDALNLEQRIAALKKSMAQSQAQLRKYEWVETTIISHKGEVKSQKEQRCYYGADGTLQKLPIGDPQPQAEEGGRRGRLKERIVEKKKDEIQEYMENAAALVKQYVPPNPNAIDAAKSSGNVALRPGDAGRVRVEITNYIKSGDMMAIDVDAAANRLLALSVNTYMDKPDDTVTLAVKFGTLDDGTTYTAQTTLDAKAKEMQVVIQNTGYRPLVQ
jgi:hypothetical protein